MPPIIRLQEKLKNAEEENEKLRNELKGATEKLKHISTNGSILPLFFSITVILLFLFPPFFCVFFTIKYCPLFLIILGNAKLTSTVSQ